MCFLLNLHVTDGVVAAPFARPFEQTVRIQRGNSPRTRSNASLEKLAWRLTTNEGNTVRMPTASIAFFVERHLGERIWRTSGVQT